MLLEASVLVSHRQAAELLLNRFSGTGVYTPDLYILPVSPVTGRCLRSSGKYDEARKYYEEAIKVCTEMRFRPEAALTWLQLASCCWSITRLRKRSPGAPGFRHQGVPEMKMNLAGEGVKTEGILKA